MSFYSSLGCVLFRPGSDGKTNREIISIYLVRDFQLAWFLPDPCTVFSQSLAVNAHFRLDHVTRNALAARNNEAQELGKFRATFTTSENVNLHHVAKVFLCLSLYWHLNEHFHELAKGIIVDCFCLLIS